jgi:predicted nucleic acid-binding protein
MPGELYLVDSNVLIRWVQPEGPQFEVVKRAILRLENADDTPCYTSQNLGEFWNVLTRPANRNGYGLSPEGARIRAEQIEAKFPMPLRFTLNGDSSWLHTASPVSRYTRPDSPPRCMCIT